VPPPAYDEILEELGQKVHYLIKKFKYKRKDIAKAIKVGDANLNAYLRRKKTPSRERLVELLGNVNVIFGSQLVEWVLDTEHSYRGYDNTPVEDRQIESDERYTRLRDEVNERDIISDARWKVLLKRLDPSGESHEAIEAEVEKEIIESRAQKKNSQ
jgi:transcriptional regulator with XRE-family HTH domain